MFRIRDPQESLWQSQFLVTPKKAKRLERSWAEVFRNEALPLIDEERFAPMYCVDNGRPNRAVQTVLGVHLLKEMFNLTDDEALEQLEFNLLWHHGQTWPTTTAAIAIDKPQAPSPNWNPEGLLGRYLKEEDEATHYEDARTGEGRRRLSVCARDLYRLVDRFHGTTAAQLEEYRL